MQRLVFIHGLGDDPTVWDVALAQPVLADFERQTLALPGYGDYRWSGETAEQVADMVASQVESNVPTILVGHSLGGVIASLVAERSPSGLVGIVNVEGNLTATGSVFTRAAAGCDDFEAWFAAFRSKSPDRYGAALDDWDKEAFLSYARDVVRLSQGDALAERYRSLDVPRLYVCGSRSTAPETRAVLAGQNAISLQAGHWVVEEQPVGFTAHLAVWAGGSAA